jgi:lipopolysaccharide transport system ATP-binding protein
MMGEVAIQVETVGKRFRLGTGRPPSSTLREALTVAARRAGATLFSPIRSIRERTRPETFWALRDVSFEVAQGEVVGIIGGNGAGKSTLLKILSRITEPTEGCVRIQGRVGSLLEVGTGFHPELSGRENTYLNGAILGMTRREIAQKFDEIVAFAEVERFIDMPVKHYSSGMYLRLAFAVAAHLEPEILIVDEVLAVGDAAFQKKCLGKMGDVARQGRTVLFVSHNLLAVETLCGRAIWLRDGRVAERGLPGHVIAQYLRANATDVTERLWKDPTTAPGNERLRLRRAAVRPKDGVPGDPIDVRTDFVMEFEYWNFHADACLNLSLVVLNAQGIMVFNAGPLGEPQPFEEGLYRDVCHVPGDLMNNGTYTAELLIVRDQHIVVYKHSDLLSFEINDSVEGRGLWHGEWQGIVRPLLDWDTKRVEGLVAHGQ